MHVIGFLGRLILWDLCYFFLRGMEVTKLNISKSFAPFFNSNGWVINSRIWYISTLTKLLPKRLTTNFFYCNKNISALTSISRNRNLAIGFPLNLFPSKFFVNFVNFVGCVAKSSKQSAKSSKKSTKRVMKIGG